MGGSTMMEMGVGTVGLGWSQMAGPMALGTLKAYREVLAFQITYNLARSSSAVLPTEQRITGPAITQDGIYGDETDGALQKYITHLVRRGLCTDVSSAEVRAIGPNAVRDCLLRSAMTATAISVMQQARDEWKRVPVRSGDGSPPPSDPYASSRTDCAARGGTWSDITHTCTEATERRVAPSEGLSTGMWILLALLGAAVAYGLYYMVTEGS